MGRAATKPDKVNMQHKFSCEIKEKRTIKSPYPYSFFSNGVAGNQFGAAVVGRVARLYLV
jgi:hypothetical protein